MLVARRPFGRSWTGGLEEALAGLGEAHERELEDAAEADERTIDLAGLTPAEPGVGAGVEHHGERLFLLEGERVELCTEGVAVGLNDGCGEFRVAVEDREDELDGLGREAVELAVHLDHDAAAGDMSAVVP